MLFYRENQKWKRVPKLSIFRGPKQSILRVPKRTLDLFGTCSQIQVPFLSNLLCSQLPNQTQKSVETIVITICLSAFAHARSAVVCSSTPYFLKRDPLWQKELNHCSHLHWPSEHFFDEIQPIDTTFIWVETLHHRV